MRDWLAHRADATPEATALATAGVSYRELDERVETLAGQLAAEGVGVDDALAVCLETRVAFAELAHAAQRLGAVLVPLDPELTPSGVRDRLDRVDPAVVVCGSDTEATVLDAADEPVVSVDGSSRATPIETVSPEPFDLPEWEKNDPLIVMFTSGTTGEPKGVLLTLSNVLASAVASAFRLGLRPDDCWHVVLPMHHMGGLAPVYRSVLYGTAVSIQSTFEPEATLTAMRDAGATCVSLVPTMLGRLLDVGSIPDLRYVLLGGAPCPPELLERAHDRGVPVAPTYGMTEAASQIATARPEEARRHPGTVGNPLMFASVTVVDDAGAPCEPGEVGELLVSGPMVTVGYLEEDATEAAFTNGGIRTGDLGYRDDAGRLWIRGRADERIITGGETVDPTEIAAALSAHDGVGDAAVVGLEDDEWGETVAALVVTENEPPTTEELLEHCRSRLPKYKRPRTIAFAEEIPRTASGTVDRDAVRAAFD